MATAKQTRSTAFQARMSGEELKMLQELSDDVGLSASAFVRQLVRRAHRERFGDKPKKR